MSINPYRALTGLLLASLLMGCSDDPGTLYIKPWAGAWDSIQEGITQSMTVTLSEDVFQKTYVDITNDYPDNVKVEPATLAFKSTRSLEVKFTGKAATAEKIKVTFALRETTQVKTFSFRVTKPVYPDSGPIPDRGVQPDMPPPADTGVEDQAVPADVAVAEDLAPTE